MDGVSLEELNLMLEMSKGLDSGSGDSLKNKLKALLSQGLLSSAEDICARLQGSNIIKILTFLFILPPFRVTRPFS
jgi:hypothetical protein